MRWLVYGGRGWIGSIVCEILSTVEEEYTCAVARADDVPAVAAEMDAYKPDRVICLVGRTANPRPSADVSDTVNNTIDYLEQPGKLVENLRDNLFAPMVLARLCEERGVHMTYMGTGCIFEGDESSEYGEEDLPNFFGSSYSVVKGYTDRLMHLFPENVLNVRIRMPITADNNRKNLLVKLMGYKRICSIPNSMSVLPNLLPIMLDMAYSGETGTVNLVNPGAITHNEILEMLREKYRPDLQWTNFTEQEQAAVLVARRSNNVLNTSKLESMYEGYVKDIHTAVRDIIDEMHYCRELLTETDASCLGFASDELNKICPISDGECVCNNDK